MQSTCLHLHISQCSLVNAGSQKSSQRSYIASSGRNESHGGPVRTHSHALQAHHERWSRYSSTEHQSAQPSRAASPSCSDSHAHQSHPLHLQTPQCSSRYVGEQNVWQSSTLTSASSAGAQYRDFDTRFDTRPPVSARIGEPCAEDAPQNLQPLHLHMGQCESALTLEHHGSHAS